MKQVVIPSDNPTNAELLSRLEGITPRSISPEVVEFEVKWAVEKGNPELVFMWTVLLVRFARAGAFINV